MDAMKMNQTACFSIAKGDVGLLAFQVKRIVLGAL